VLASQGDSKSLKSLFVLYMSRPLIEDPACRNVPGHPHRHHPLQRHHPHRLQVLGGPRYAFCLPFVLHWRGPVEHVAPSMAACSRLREQPEPYSLPGVCLPWQSRCRPTPTPRSSPTRASAVTFPATTPPLSPPPPTPGLAPSTTPKRVTPC